MLANNDKLIKGLILKGLVIMLIIKVVQLLTENYGFVISKQHIRDYIVILTSRVPTLTVLSRQSTSFLCRLPKKINA